MEPAIGNELHGNFGLDPLDNSESEIRLRVERPEVLPDSPHASDEGSLGHPIRHFGDDESHVLAIGSLR
ncbi:hypothetical protein BO1005MUT1_530251 [Hyphomicrobiales bacterium]|nr:hypothetical protein BO1005MUT1_530251 [Hyphomicrobiales bacterium]